MPNEIEDYNDEFERAATELRMKQSPIRTSFVNPPIGFRGCDWVAWMDGDEEGLRAFGKTEQEAINSLNELIEDLGTVPTESEVRLAVFIDSMLDNSSSPASIARAVIAELRRLGWREPK